MRLLGQVSRKYGETEYKKHWVIIPNKIIEKLGWKIGDELELEVKGEKLVIERV
ncbi:MAG: AbrB/MazE/SpoVT family DNA-binding domain-containing protein [Candidatus Aenigmarchaeota archaeon]|nr:AbrB/MazE/SpoVT family DNA-binding domain-containing protein [Candidatus Aenigmarchaeota archaeon]